MKVRLLIDTVNLAILNIRITATGKHDIQIIVLLTGKVVERFHRDSCCRQEI